jgi:hypothetical protein
MRDLVINGNAIDIAGYARQQDSGTYNVFHSIPQLNSMANDVIVASHMYLKVAKLHS